jgi:hypothetical protein
VLLLGALLVGNDDLTIGELLRVVTVCGVCEYVSCMVSKGAEHAADVAAAIMQGAHAHQRRAGRRRCSDQRGGRGGKGAPSGGRGASRRKAAVKGPEIRLFETKFDSQADCAPQETLYSVSLINLSRKIFQNGQGE